MTVTKRRKRGKSRNKMALQLLPNIERSKFHNKAAGKFWNELAGKFWNELAVNKRRKGGKFRNKTAKTTRRRGKFQTKWRFPNANRPSFPLIVC